MSATEPDRPQRARRVERLRRRLLDRAGIGRRIRGRLVAEGGELASLLRDDEERRRAAAPASTAVDALDEAAKLPLVRVVLLGDGHTADPALGEAPVERAGIGPLEAQEEELIDLLGDRKAGGDPPHGGGGAAVRELLGRRHESHEVRVAALLALRRAPGRPREAEDRPDGDDQRGEGAQGEDLATSGVEGVGAGAEPLDG
jgi:hypothetical protein